MVELEHKDMSSDKVFTDLMQFARQLMGKAAHDALLRFKWGGYDYGDAVGALTLVACHILATLNHNIIPPEQLTEIVKSTLLEIYKDYDEDTD
jgi:hypothetical protein